MSVFTIDPFDVCNMSTMPVAMLRNPIRQTAHAILHDPHSTAHDAHPLFWTVKPRRSLADLFHTPCEILDLLPFRTLFLPWLHYRPVPIDRFQEAFLQIYTDPSGLTQKYETIRSITESIQRLGYHPERFPTRHGDHITGHFLSNEIRRRFFVVSGNHRIAVLAALSPAQRVKVTFTTKASLKPRDLECSILADLDNYPNDFSTSSIASWPSVASGFLTRDIALQIAHSYLEA